MPNLPDLPSLALSCTPCLANAQVLAAGTFDDDPDIVALIRDQDYGGSVEVFHDGSGMCLRHFNTHRHWPKDYPADPLPEAFRDELRDRYDAILDRQQPEGDDDDQ